jgi:hypothetical protein
MYLAGWPMTWGFAAFNIPLILSKPQFVFARHLELLLLSGESHYIIADSGLISIGINSEPHHVELTIDVRPRTTHNTSSNGWRKLQEQGPRARYRWPQPATLAGA